MKFQPKRFVVEVKRGTSRAAFASVDPAGNRFSNAEAMLFGAQQPKAESPAAADAGKAAGRILRSLVEPPEPVGQDDPEPVRRGRKPGSKNKPKSPVLAGPAAIALDGSVERPRRGRKPGSKNKPKLVTPSSIPDAAAFRQPSAAAASAMRSYGFSEDPPGLHDDTTPAAPAVVDSPPGREPRDATVAADAAPERRSRLRERSAILRRYVLDTEPRPGQPGAIRARRAARTGR